MHVAGPCLQEDCFLLGQATIYQAHCELAVKVSKRADTSHKKVDVVVFHIVGKQALNSDYFDFVAELLCELS